jgi:predicted outer membrane repeat protein
MRSKHIIAIVFAIAFLLAQPTDVSATQRIIFVNASATGAGDGSSWPDAFPHLQDALAATMSGEEIWVAAGTYRPDQGVSITPGDRQAAFVMKGGVALFGGFAGDEQRRDDRDFTAHPTILSGDLLQNDDEVLEIENPLRSDNSLRVVFSETVEPVAVDGFTIRGANALEEERDGGWGLVVDQSLPNTGSYTFSNLILEQNTGEGGAAVLLAGLRSTMNPVVFKNVVFRYNGGEDASGGGMWVFSSYVRMENVDFINNIAAVGGALLGNTADIEWVRGSAVGNAARAWGGAVHMLGENNSHLEGANLLFIENSAERSTGGAISLDEASLQLANSVFIGNSATTRGGALFVGAGAALLSNCTLVGNRAETGGGALYNFATTDTVHIDNSILWGNASTTGPSEIFNDVFNDGHYVTLLRNSILGGPLAPGVIDGGGLIFDDPAFMNAVGPDGISGTADDDLRLSAASPAIDAGLNVLVPADRVDIDGDGNLDETMPADLDGNRRVFAARGGATIVDMGAYEFGAPALSTTVEGAKIPRTAIGDVELFPNPATDRITLLLKGPDDATQKGVKAIVYDVLGRVVMRVSFEQEADQEKREIVLGDEVVSGVYILSIQDNAFRAYKMFIVAK